jgi:hypothetical protein
MFVKLTNCSEGFKGQPLYINVNQIASIYEYPRESGGSLTTCIYGGQTGLVWNVEEGLMEVLKKIKEVQK